jgi:Flp pilus assembly secretin CpaC
MKTIRNEMLARLKNVLVVSMCVWGGAMIAQADDLIVLKGSSARVAVDGIRKVTVANPAIIDAKPALDGQSVLVSGISEGNSELRIERLQGAELITNVVVRSDLNEMFDQIKQLLSDVEGLDISIMGNKILLKGKILTKSDNERVNKVVTAYSNLILNMSTFDASGMSHAYEQAILQEIGLDTITAKVMNDTVILEGVVYSLADKNRAEQIAALKMPNVKSMLTVQDVMIETDVQFVEVSGDKGKDMGFNVLDSFDAQLNATAGPGGTGARGRIPVTFGASASAEARLKALINSSTAKIVDSPHLSTKSGETGSFQSGGTKYFQVSGTTSGDLKSVDYGVIVKVKPTLQGRDRVLNEVSIEVSIPVSDPTAVMALEKYTTACTELCKVGESMVISGMTQKLANSASSKTPLLGDIPLLNLFFSNKTSDKQRNEFVIVVTPQPVFPTAAVGSPFGEQHKDLLQNKDKD